jgi:hypothetical protein
VDAAPLSPAILRKLRRFDFIFTEALKLINSWNAKKQYTAFLNSHQPAGGSIIAEQYLR